MNETKMLGDIIRDQEYAAAREFIRRKYPDAGLGATALMEFSLERNEYFRKIAEQAQQIVTAVVNTTVMPPLVVPNFPRSSQNQTVSSGVEGAHEGTTADKKGEPEKLNKAQCTCMNEMGLRFKITFHQRSCPMWAESSLSSPPEEKE